MYHQAAALQAKNAKSCGAVWNVTSPGWLGSQRARLTKRLASLVALAMRIDFASELRRARSLGELGGSPGRVRRFRESANLGERRPQSIQQLGVVRVGQGYSPRGQFHRLLSVAKARLGLSGEQPRQIIQSLNPIGPEPNGFVIMLAGRFHLIARQQRDRQLIVRLGKVGPDRQGLPIMSSGFLHAALPRQSAAQEIIDLGPGRRSE